MPAVNGTMWINVNIYLWTRNKLKEKLAEIIADVGSKMKRHDKKGVKMKMIIDIDPLLLVMLPIHVKLGILNKYFYQTMVKQ